MTTAAGKQTEAARYLSFAETLLGRGDLVGSKRFAETALESDPLLPGVDQILAVADVLLAAQQHHVNNQPNWYSLLQLDPSSYPDLTAVKRNYRRLALLLHPDSNKSPGAADAFKLVVDAFAILSDPAKKSLFDAELNIAVAAAPHAAAATTDPFWTACPACLHVYEYPRRYQNRLLRCPTCHRPFRATEAPAPPPLVPNTTMYYSSWGFFPLGYAGSGAPTSANLPDHTAGWKPSHPLTSWWNPQQPAPADPAPQPQPHPNARNETATAVTATPPPPKSNKKTTRKSVRNSAGKNPAPAQTEPQPQPVPISTVSPLPKLEEPENEPVVVPEPIAPVPLAWEALVETNTTTDQEGEGGAEEPSAGKNPAPAQTEPQPVPISTVPPLPKLEEPEKEPAVVPEPIAPVPLAWEALVETNTTTGQGGEGGVEVNDTPMEADAEGSEKANDTAPMEADAPPGELMGNLQSTPVLKDEEIKNETPNM